MFAFISHLAQIGADAVGPLVQWIIGGSGAMFLLNQALTFYKEHIREQPTPSNTYATKEEMKYAHGRITRERAEINAALAKFETEQLRREEEIDKIITAVRTELKAENGGLHSRFTERLGLVREMKGRMESVLEKE